MKTKVQYQGTKKQIELLCENDDDVEQFLAGLTSGDRRKVDVLFERLGDHGVINNTEKFKKLEGTDGVFEFKSFQIRLLCFMHRNRVIICRSLMKKRDKHDKADITFVEACRKKFIGE